jgi:hypothetical protein
MTRRPSADRRRADPPPPPVDYSAQYQPDPGTPLRHCGAPGCGAAYLDDDPGRRAHAAVFNHSPRPRQPASPAREDPQ